MHDCIEFIFVPFQNKIYVLSTFEHMDLLSIIDTSFENNIVKINNIQNYSICHWVELDTPPRNIFEIIGYDIDTIATEYIMMFFNKSTSIDTKNVYSMQNIILTSSEEFNLLKAKYYMTFAANVKTICSVPWYTLVGIFDLEKENKAAIRIQSVFKGWKARIENRFSPFTSLGRYYLMQEYKNIHQ